MTIKFKKNIDIDAVLFTCPEGVMPSPSLHASEATPDDLRRACEAAGLALVDDVVPSDRAVLETMLANEREFREKAEAALVDEKAARVEAEALIAQVRDILIDIESDEDIVETARRTAGAVDLVVRQRDDAMAERDASQKERDALCAKLAAAEMRIGVLTAQRQAVEAAARLQEALSSASSSSPPPDPSVVPQDVHEGGWQWRPVDDGAFAPPFGTIRKCLDCDCLVAGGPNRCARCASAEEAFTMPIEKVEAELRAAGADPEKIAADGIALVEKLKGWTRRPIEPRATEEELGRLAYEAQRSGPTDPYPWSERSPDIHERYICIASAVATRVRAERPACLVERAVRTNVDIEIAEAADPRNRYIRVTPPCLKDDLARTVPNAEAAATLDAMLTEVGA